ncbi:hypothetical protein [Nocardia sp. alder85J]|uniref:hypothetical protein n=1 Tax=Nocardia sp. alder85J TaxID=2862949 RepID=UPI001CD2357C|nr:hypothetical protein [Nocardia sp. alder85J]MCX4095809.1 hypothetical protein [Nocardia sp. alder85J]
MEWRATTSQQAQDDLDALLHASIEVVAELLGESGSFAPFMLTLAQDGSRSLRPLAGRADSADPARITRALTLSGDTIRLRARATVCDVTAHEPITGDAIQIRAEHREGIAIDLLIPYRIDDDSVDIAMNAANAAIGTCRLWPPS